MPKAGLRVRTSLLRRYHPPDNIPGQGPGPGWSAPPPRRPRVPGRDLALLVLAAAVVVLINVVFGARFSDSPTTSERDGEQTEATE